MFGDHHLRVPVGADAHRWRTFPAERVLVVAARTVTSTVRTLEALPSLLRGDPRVAVVFAYDDTSAFNAGVLDVLHDAGCRVMPWGQLRDISPDLVLTASENIEVPEGDYPVLVLPHGVGFQKYVPDSRSSRTRLSGVVSDSLLASGRAWLAVSHPAQREQLRSAHPESAGRTVLVGDPCLDEIVASRPLRRAYRKALGVADHQRLVVVSSTWGPTSLLGRQPDLPARLLAGLCYDGHRVAAVVHPNVWSAHGAWQIRAHQSAALDAGLLLMPPVHAWRAAVAAADVVVGDHGSVTLYAAASGRPVLLAAFGEDSVAGTAAADLAATAHHLDLHGNVPQQIEDAVREHRPETYARLAERAFADPGRALPRMRALLYELLKLPEPSSPPPAARTLPVPDVVPTPVTAWEVVTSAAWGADEPAVQVTRFPASVAPPAREDAAAMPGSFTHLACCESESDSRLVESASVVLGARPASTAGGAQRWIRETLARLPGCLAAATTVRGGGCLVGLRDGRVVEATPTGVGRDPGLAAAAVYACVRAGAALDDVWLKLRITGVGDENVLVGLRPRLPAGDD
ncbi:hypothetical protein [Streptomyces sp. Da 82-17]|uniref:hypothetical protein n=1 Tax=Streptomyces sp. Da 82-17 TaxID=3377116 RepID=UPI0038D50ACF